METPSGAKQRSPWLYVLLGCGGLAGLICLGTMIVVGLGVKAVKDVGEGVTDPAERQKNALKQLGALPEGYTVVASLSVFVMQTTILTDREMLPDGGFVLGDGHTFSYFRVMANDNNKRARDFLQGKDTDPAALKQNGINIDAKDIVKRGQLTIDGRKFSYVASRGRLEGQGQGGAPEAGLNNAILFECPGEQLQVGVWSQLDPAPEKTAEELDLAGTVADEAQLAKFLKPMNPCGR
ncbi:MAG: hypothetical protein Q8L48_28815 [Archangium sp.]|nr:hypothetical protein [Archangium sp.]